MQPEQSAPAAPSPDGNTAVTSTAPEFQPITSQDDLNRVVGERLARERSKFADYDDLRAKAARLDQIEDQNKTELQRLNEQREAAERERDRIAAEALRWRVAARFGVSTAPAADGGPSDADLFLTGTDEETLERQAQRLVANAPKPQPQGLDLRIDNSGRPAEPVADKDAIARAFFGL